MATLFFIKFFPCISENFLETDYGKMFFSLRKSRDIFRLVH